MGYFIPENSEKKRLAKKGNSYSGSKSIIKKFVVICSRVFNKFIPPQQYYDLR